MAASVGFATPAAPEMTLREARDLYLRENGFSLEMYTEATFAVPAGPFTLQLPNPRERQRVVGAHDLHHVVTGYGTDLIGEIEVSAWEVRGGLGGSWVAWLLCVPFTLLGTLVSPRRTLRAWRGARGARSLLHPDPAPETLLDLTLRDARIRLGVPPQGAAEHPARLNARAPGSQGPAATEP